MSAEGEQSSSGGASTVSNPKAGNKWKEAQPDGLVNGQVSFSMKRRRHMSSERQRRVHMNTLLESLQELLPDPKPRKDRCTLLIDVIDYLRALEGKTQELGTRKEAIMRAQREAKEAAACTAAGAAACTAAKAAACTAAGAAAAACNLHCVQNVHVQVFKSHKLTRDNHNHNYHNHNHNHNDNMEEIIITFTSLQTRGLISHIITLLSINRIEIINASFSTTSDHHMLHFIHAQVPKDLNLKSDDMKALFSSSSEGPKDLNLKNEDMKALLSSPSQIL